MYKILPSMSYTAGHLVVIAQHSHATHDGDGALAATAPPSAPRHSPDNDSFCTFKERCFATACHEDMLRLCPDATTTDKMMACFDNDRDNVSQKCLDTMHQFSQCFYGPQLVIPMEIASFLLLATASIVLLCTLLRCCCRYVCLNGSIGSVQLEGGADDDEPTITEDDDEPTVTPLPTGVKASEGHNCCETELDEDLLPTYTEVVDGATVINTQALKSSGAPSSHLPHNT